MAMEDGSSLIDIKAGKVVLKQKPMNFEKLSETMSEIVRFRAALEEHIAGKKPALVAVPEEYLPVVAKLVQESEKSLNALSKHVHSILIPAPSDSVDDTFTSPTQSNPLPLAVATIETAILSIATRVNYGLDKLDDNGPKIPAAMCIWRWEVKPEHRDWLPKSAREKCETRTAERVKAKQYLHRHFQDLSQDERDALLKTKQSLKDKGTPNGRVKTTDSATTSAEDAKHVGNTGNTETNGNSPSKAHNAVDDENGQSDSPASRKPGRPKKPLDPERELKDKEKQEKKLAKHEKFEKDKKAQDKSRNLMASFFGAKPKPLTTNAVASGSTTRAEPAVHAQSPDKGPSDFDKTFKPFVVKKGTELAPVNWFVYAKANRHKAASYKGKDAEIIVIDDDIPGAPSGSSYVNGAPELVSVGDDMDVSASSASGPDYIASTLRKLPAFNADLANRPPEKSSFKTASMCSVRQLMTHLSEAEVSVDEALVRSIRAQLADRSSSAIPAKVLIFHEDTRPGYYGTFTKTSTVIGSRTPFAKDAIALDYGYDSGEEWEPEEEGDQVNEQEDEEEGSDVSDDSDLDSWLVDDDEVEEVGTPSSEPAKRSPSPFDVPMLMVEKKRKAEKEDGDRNEKKRRVVVPLVPFTKGPCWDDRMGECEYEPMEPYRIQLLNDTPYPIDPFTFVSTPFESHRGADTKPDLPSLEDPRGADPAAENSATPSKTGKPAATSRPKPKSVFPDAHLPLLVERIVNLKTPSLITIVESLYVDLKDHNVKKNAIEAKVKEVSEKNKEKKVWSLRPDIEGQHSKAAV